MRSSLRHVRPSTASHARAIAALCIALISLSACEGSTRTAGGDSSVTAAPPSTDSGASTAMNAGWNADAGAILLVAGDAPGLGEVIFPEVTDSTFGDSALMDLAPVRGAQVTLFSRRGEVGNATVVGEDTTAQADSSDDSCEDWPLVRLRTESRAPTAAWTVGLVAGHARSMPLDSIEHLPRADSIRLASEVVRLAEGLPDDTARAFRGLPFYVRTAKRFQPAPGIQALVADVSRRINQEADPREEQLLLVAERDSGQDRWAVARRIPRAAHRVMKARSRRTTSSPACSSVRRIARRWCSAATSATASPMRCSSGTAPGGGSCAG